MALYLCKIFVSAQFLEQIDRFSPNFIYARVDSRLWECDNHTFLTILALNFKFPAWLLRQNAEIWRNSSNPVHIVVPSVCISVPLFYSIRLIPLIPANLVF